MQKITKIFRNRYLLFLFGVIVGVHIVRRDIFPYPQLRLFRENIMDEKRKKDIDDSLIKINEYYCGIDEKRKWILAPYDGKTGKDFIGQFKFSSDYYEQIVINGNELFNGDIYNFGKISTNDSFDIEIYRNDQIKVYTLTFTTLSTLIFFTEKEIRDEPKIKSELYVNDLLLTKTHKKNADIEIRGGTSKSFPKLSYDFELSESQDYSNLPKLSFMGLRNDDDWILDAMYIDSSLSRNLLGMKIWGDISNAVHVSDEKQAKIFQSGFFVELFINNDYLGIYSLNEPIDKKQLALKSKGGRLYKPEWWTDEALFQGINSRPIDSLEWAGYQLKYPKSDDSKYWDPLYNLIDLTINAGNKDFKSQISNYLDIDNMVDYYIFLNLIMAEDNHAKNLYLFRYDKGYPISVCPWDIDLAFHNKNSEWTIDSPKEMLITNNLFDRLYQLDVDGYRKKVKQKWDSLFYQVDFNKYYDYLENNKNILTYSSAIKRNNERWGLDIKIDKQIQQLKTFIEFRKEFINSHISDNF